MSTVLSFANGDIAAAGTYIPHKIAIRPSSDVTAVGASITDLNGFMGSGSVDLTNYLDAAEVYEVKNSRKVVPIPGIIGNKGIINIPGDATAVFPTNLRDYFMMALQRGSNPWNDIVTTGTAQIETGATPPNPITGTVTSLTPNNSFTGTTFSIVIQLMATDASSGTGYMIMPKVVENSEAQNMSMNTGVNSNNLSFLALNLTAEERGKWDDIVSIDANTGLFNEIGQFYQIHVQPVPNP